MQFTTTAILAAAAALVAAQQTHPYDGYIDEVCQPLNTSGLPDMNAPCNQVAALQLQCMYGPVVGLAAFDAVNNPNLTNPLEAEPAPALQSRRVQQVCVCESQLWPAFIGCATCERAHGSGDLLAFLDADFIDAIAGAYCVASATPSLGFANFLLAAPTSLPASQMSAYKAAQTSSFSDPIGNSTAISYYYTPSVTGTAAWIVAEQTGTAGPSGPGTFTSVVSSGGQIVPTASANIAAAQTTASTSSSAGAGARETAAAMGVVGLLGLAALL